MKVQDKLDYIEREINLVPNYNSYIKETKRECLLNYKARLFELEQVDKEIVLSFDYANEIYNKAENKEKQVFISKIIDISVGIEKHIFAPELNKLVLTTQFKAGKKIEPNYIKVPSCYDYKQVREHLQKLSLYDIKSILLHYNLKI